MRSHRFLVAALIAATASAQDAAPLSKREAAFKKLMSGATMEGWFTTAGRGSLKPEPDRYVIARVEKVEGDLWRFEANMSAAKRKRGLPIGVFVRWAGDTPMLQVTKMKIPFMGTYSARVLIYEGQYAGTWSAEDHGGHMFGRIVQAGSGKKQNGGKQESRSTAGKDQAFWPSFRGPRASGVVSGPPAATTFDVEDSVNLQWKTRVPGLAHSSPVIWGNRIYLTTATKDGEADLKVGLYGSVRSVEDDSTHEMQVLCLDRRDGRVLWTRTAWSGVPKIKRHPKGSHAASTPATDGRHLVAFFGSEGLYTYDIQGKLLWKKDLGVLDSGFFRMPGAQWGFASSPVIHGGRVLVQCDVQGQSFVAALDVRTGAELWRTKRDEVPTWSTPTVDVRPGRSQVILNGWKHIGGYDLETGKELWKLRGGGDIPVPTPVVAGDTIFITNAHGRQAPILAIDAAAEGAFTMDAAESRQMRWSHTRRGNYMQTPLVLDGLLYCCNDRGVLSCYEAGSGEVVYRERLSAGIGFSASGIAVAGRLYFTSEEGQVHVVAAGRTFQKLGVSELGETCMASPAAAAGTLYFRTRHHLVAVGDPKTL